MTTLVAVLVGVAGGIALLAAVFLFAFRRKTPKEKPVKSAENHDVFEKETSIIFEARHRCELPLLRQIG